MIKRNLKELERFDIDDNIHFCSYENANEAFEKTYLKLNAYGEECAPRGLKVRELRNVMFEIKNPMDNIIYNKWRQASPLYLAKENLWYLSGNRDVESIAKSAPFWRTIANEDGTVNSNYGYYLFNVKNEEGKSQFDLLEDLLRKDSFTRKALFVQPVCGDKSLGIPDTRFTKDTICTPTYNFQLRNNKLELTVNMRSNDLINGTTNDIVFFCNLQIEMAKRLGVELGSYYHIANNIHVYEESNKKKCFIEETDFDLDKTEFNYKYPESVKDYDYEHDFNILASSEFDKKNPENAGLINDRYIYLTNNKYNNVK